MYLTTKVLQTEKHHEVDLNILDRLVLPFGKTLQRWIIFGKTTLLQYKFLSVLLCKLSRLQDK